ACSGAIMWSMPGDDVTPSVTPASQASRHSGPGYVANATARDFEIHEPLKEAAARWLDFVPAKHRHEGRESAKYALETLQEHTRSCPDHPLGPCGWPITPIRPRPRRCGASRSRCTA